MDDFVIVWIISWRARRAIEGILKAAWRISRGMIQRKTQKALKSSYGALFSPLVTRIAETVPKAGWFGSNPRRSFSLCPYRNDDAFDFGFLRLVRCL